jgi:hypothetical protein
LGIRAEEMGGNLPFDVLALHNGRSIRIQVKTTGTYRSANRFRFLTWRGRFALTNDRPITPYSTSETDFVALVALPLEAVVFRHVSEIGPTTTLDRAEFMKPDCAWTSFQAASKVL